jgi:hypothetical protein
MCCIALLVLDEPTNHMDVVMIGAGGAASSSMQCGH